ncbi:hypothetical protein TAMA11512_16540 [Selenomonas sp. TAMA-11512]|uniref:TetR/AcrR family transcriptional regulator n=1 Tax=Selenomonas sp. TAMA-11512 TaxID=3095337 RepID=UPI00308C8CD4|nr:hypothetical protein TAMA11512_16540 [Selenomonas sp. TAMA-11512]
MGKAISKREQKKRLYRSAILDAAVTLFAQKGVHETSIADIMASANLGLGTFYNYFGSKEEILMELLKNIVEDIEARLSLLRQEKRETAVVLEDLLLYTAELLSKNRFVMPLFLRAAEHAAAPSMPPEQAAAKPDRPSAPAFKEIFNTITDEGQKSGEFRSDIPSGVITELFHSLFQAAAFSTLGLRFEENIRLKVRIIIDGMKAK